MPVNETTLVSPIFDQLQQAMVGDPAGFTELYRDYMADAWQIVRALRSAVERQQAQEISEPAHRLKGSSLVLGARGVAQCAAALEEMGRNADIQGAGAMLQPIGQALREVESELADRLGAGVIPAGKTGAW